MYLLSILTEFHDREGETTELLFEKKESALKELKKCFVSFAEGEIEDGDFEKELNFYDDRFEIKVFPNGKWIFSIFGKVEEIHCIKG